MPLNLHIVTAERLVYSDEVDMVIAPGSVGELGILPSHAALVTTLQPGGLRARKGADEVELAISGGFMEVRDNRVLVLADTAERADEIDIERAHAAEARARQLLEERRTATDLTQVEQALRRSQVRLKVARRRRAEEAPR